MERALSSWGLSFASQIDFPPLWPGQAPPRRLPGSAWWIRHKPNPDLHQQRKLCASPSECLGLWMPSLNAGLLFFLTFSPDTHLHSNRVLKGTVGCKLSTPALPSRHSAHLLIQGEHDPSILNVRSSLTLQGKRIL